MDDGVPVTSLSMRKRGKLFLGGSILAAMLALAPGVAGLGTAAWAAPEPLNYVALGDSYAVGLSLGTVVGDVPACGQTAASYPRQLAAALDLDLTDMTCSGATTANVIDTAQGANPAQISALSASTDIVTLTIGGNNLGFTSIVQACLAAGAGGPLLFSPAAASCKSLYAPGGVDSLAAEVAGPVTASLDATLDAIKLAAPNAKIFVVGYPSLMPGAANIPPAGCFTQFTGSTPAFPFTDVDIDYLRGVQTQLDTSMSNVAVAKDATFVPMLSSTLAFSPCANNPGAYVSGASMLPGAMHPTALGATFQTETTTSAIMSTFTAPSITPPATNYWAQVGVMASVTFTATGFPEPTLSLTGTLPAGMTFDADTGILSGIPTAGGEYYFSITATNALTSVTTGYFMVVYEPPAITSAAPTGFGTVGTPYSFTVTASGTIIPTLTLNGSLPDGLIFTPGPGTGTGTISGTPTTAGTFSFSVTAENWSPERTSVTSDTYTITVDPAGVAPMITSSAPPAAKVGSEYSFKVVATGYPAPTFAVTSGALPKGLSLNAASGAISGTPTEAGKFAFSITASNATDPASTVQYAIEVAAQGAVTPGVPNIPALVTTGSASFLSLGLGGGILLLAGAALVITRRFLKR